MSTYSTNLALELIGTGEQAGTWGNTTNTNLGTLIEQAISGYVTQAVATGTDTTLTIPNGATGVARNMYIELTGTGGTNTNLVVPANKKLYFIYNNSTGAVTVKVAGQTGVSVPQNAKLLLVSNGTDVVPATSYVTSGGTISFDSLVVTNLAATSATITTLNGTSATITTFGSTSANITTLSGTSANITTLTGTSSSVTNASAASLTVTTGNANFTGTGQRITGDMSNATVTNRLFAQTSTTNGATTWGILPNGTSNQAAVSCLNNSDPTNASFVGLVSMSTAHRLQSSQTGSGTYLPLTIYQSGAEKAQFTTTGNFLVGTTTDVSGRSGVISDVAGNVRAIPRTGSAKTSNYTLAITDVGQFVELGTGGAIDVPNGIFATGDVISVFNNTTGARPISLTITTAYIGGTDADKASVSLATRGVATILFISNSVCVVNGNVS